MKHHQHNLPAIYRITRISDGKVYIGQARRAHERWTSHQAYLRRGRHSNGPLQEAWSAGAESDFAWDIVCQPLGPHDPETMTYLEVEVVRNYPDNFTLMVPVQAYLAAKPSTRAKLSVQRLEMWADPDFKAKRVAALRAQKEDPEYRERHSEAMRAFNATPEGIKTRRDAGVKAWAPEDVRRRQGAKTRAHWEDPEHRAKQEASRRAAWEDPKKRENRIAGLKGAWAKMTPEEREARVKKVAQSQRDPEHKAAQAERMRAIWAERKRLGITIHKKKPGSRRSRSRAAPTQGKLF